MDTGGHTEHAPGTKPVRRFGCARILIVAVICVVLAVAAVIIYACLSLPRPARIAWSAETPGPLVFGLHLRKNGGVIFSGKESIILFNADGTKAAEYKPAVQGFWKCVLDESGNVYAGGHGGYVYALDADGNERWKLQIPDESVLAIKTPQRATCVALTEQGDLLVQTNCGELVRMDCNGNIGQRAAFDLKFSNIDGPLLLPNGNVAAIKYTRGGPATVVGLDFDGDVRWEFNAPGFAVETLDLLDDRIVVNVHQGKIYGLDLNGKEVWSFENPDPPSSPGALHSYDVLPYDKQTVAVCTRPYLFLLDKDGKIVRQISQGPYGGLLRRDSHSFYTSTFRTNPGSKLFWWLYQQDPRVNKYLRRPQSGAALLLLDNFAERKVELLPQEFALQCGPGAEGELYGYAYSNQPGSLIGPNIIVYRIDP